MASGVTDEVTLQQPLYPSCPLLKEVSKHVGRICMQGAYVCMYDLCSDVLHVEVATCQNFAKV